MEKQESSDARIRIKDLAKRMGVLAREIHTLMTPQPHHPCGLGNEDISILHLDDADPDDPNREHICHSSDGHLNLEYREDDGKLYSLIYGEVK